ncbi:hypothetical protein B23_1946 [Geobacillus thermoleovorans B23]|nr:hypothetical protein B23_1946 [Geobacillus thermoleovorans B23]
MKQREIEFRQRTFLAKKSVHFFVRKQEFSSLEGNK